MTVPLKIFILLSTSLLMACSENVREANPESLPKPSDLKVEGLTNPIGIHTDLPKFSWKVKAEGNNVHQEAYQILVASTPDKLNETDVDLWNSGKVMSDQNLHVAYEGRPLKSRDRCFWKVKLGTNKGGSQWSAVKEFTVALLHYKDWKARWIGFYEPFPWEHIGQFPKVGARYLRKGFAVKGAVRKATVYLSGLGLYELYLNGQKVGNAELAPAPTDYTKNVMYNVLDVTEQLKSGENAVGVVLGNGRYLPMRPVYKPYKIKEFGLPKLLFQMEVQYADGSSEVVTSGTDWKGTADGPIRNNNEYDGEYYDARKAFPGWAQSGFDDSDWLPAEYMTEPGGDYQAQINENMKVMKTIQPVDIRKHDSDTYILDMGQNFAGWLQLRVQGRTGTKVQLRFAESLNEDGSLFTTNLRDARATDTYILRGEGQEVWEPTFTYHGFRYVAISGYPGTPTPGDFEGKLVYDEMANVGTFVSSNDLLNQIYENAWWGIASNYKGMPVDCPQRNERQPWLADHAVGAYGESFLFDHVRLYEKWLQDIRMAQKADGSLPDVAPPYWNYYSDNMTWPGTLLIIADMLYQQTGNPEVITDNYPAMKKWLRYMQGRYMQGYLFTKDSYGDWCKPPESIAAGTGKNADKKEPSQLIATAYGYQFLLMMQAFARVSGNTADIAAYQSLASQVRQAFHEAFYREGGFYGEGKMTEQVLPLHFGLVEEPNQARVFHYLEKVIEEKGGHLSTGLIGTQWLMRTLTEYGRPDLAYQIATHTTYPSWGYMIANGATTIWELWHGNVAHPKMNSQNHVMMLGDLLVWYYESLAGIKAAKPGYYQIDMKPEFSVGLNFVKASYASAQGMIRSEWQKSADGLEWKMTIPANSRALVHFAAEKSTQITEKSGAEHVRFLRQEGDRLVYEVPSGQWEFSVKN